MDDQSLPLVISIASAAISLGSVVVAVLAIRHQARETKVQREIDAENRRLDGPVPRIGFHVEATADKQDEGGHVQVQFKLNVIAGNEGRTPLVLSGRGVYFLMVDDTRRYVLANGERDLLIEPGAAPTRLVLSEGFVKRVLRDVDPLSPITVCALINAEFHISHEPFTAEQFRAFTTDSPVTADTFRIIDRLPAHPDMVHVATTSGDDLHSGRHYRVREMVQEAWPRPREMKGRRRGRRPVHRNPSE